MMKPTIILTFLSLSFLPNALSLSLRNNVDSSSSPQFVPETNISPKSFGSPNLPPERVRIPRKKTCQLTPLGSGKDDGPQILDAVKKCNNGGRVVFKENHNYTIGTALDLTFMNGVDLDIRGTLKWTNDTTYWATHSFNLTFQNATTFWQIGGNDVNIYGGGTLDGSGQAWYDAYAKDIYILRPVLMGVIGLKGGTIRDLKFRFSPQYYHFVANSSDVVFDNIDISGASTSNNVAKNTDGWDTYRSEYITIQNSKINNGDDCVSFKPNSTNIIVQNLVCNGSHGISVGSLGQYPGAYDIVENVYVYNISMSNASDGARIKVWPGVQSAMSGDLQGGGGGGRVKNVTYDTFYNFNNDYAIELTQCYGQTNQTLCDMYPSSLTISDIWFKNFWGTTSKKYDPKVGTLICSSPSVCSNINAHNISISAPSGKTPYYSCVNVNDTLLDLPCQSQ